MAKRAAAAGARLTLQYTLAPEERERAYQLRLRATAGERMARVMNVAPPVVIVAALGIVLVTAARTLWTAEDPTFPVLVAAVSLLACLPVLMVVFPATRKALLFRRAAPETVVLDAAGVEHRPEIGPARRWRWDEVASAEARGGFVVFSVRGQQPVLVPLRAADDGGGRRRMSEMVRDRMGDRARLDD